MAKNRIDDLRNHLFETLEALKDTETPMDLDRARAICQVSKTIIESAKVEVDLVKAVNGRALEAVQPGSRFFEVKTEGKDADQPKPALRLAAGGGR